jgi:hypothetical protein
MPDNTRKSDVHSHVHLAISVLYVLGCIGFDKATVGPCLAICYYLLYCL